MFSENDCIVEVPTCVSGIIGTESLTFQKKKKKKSDKVVLCFRSLNEGFLFKLYLPSFSPSLPAVLPFFSPSFFRYRTGTKTQQKRMMFYNSITYYFLGLSQCTECTHSCSGYTHSCIPILVYCSVPTGSSVLKLYSRS